MRFIDLFAGLGGFRVALERLGHECVFACEIDSQLREVYNASPTPTIDSAESRTYLRTTYCVPVFLASGAQAGLSDRTTGTLFHEILEILRKHEPRFVILENVGNFERHDQGRTWSVVKSSLDELGYEVKGTEHVTSGGDGLLSPHHLGFPHHRERFFAVASLEGLPENPFPPRNRKALTSMASVVQLADELSERDRDETCIADQHRRCIEHWNSFLDALPEDEVALPSFPIWGDEIDATYSYDAVTPWAEVRAAEKDWVSDWNGTSSPWELFDALPTFIENKNSLSKSYLRRRLRGSLYIDGEDLEFHLDLLLTEVDRRKAIAEATYPFTGTETGISRASVSDESPYEFLLWLAISPKFREERRIGEIDQLFDNLVKQALIVYLGPGSKGVRFGFPSSDGRPPGFPEAVNWLANLLGLGTGAASPRCE